jgi:hypothetical protein
VHALPAPVDVPDRTPSKLLTTETYLGYTRFAVTRYVGAPTAPVKNAAAEYHVASTVPDGDVSFGGSWDQQQWDMVAGQDSVIELSFTADDVYLVLGGTGEVGVSEGGRRVTTVHVSGVPDLYTMYAPGHYGSGLLTLDVSPGVQAYDFTFG